MNIFLAQQNYHIGNFEANTARIIEAIHAAEARGADLVVFSELCVCGYPPRDFLEFEDFIARSYAALDEIKAHTQKTAVLVGAPQRNPHREGKDLFNAAFFLFEGEIKQVVQKTLLPTYDVFDEYRYFEPGFEWNVIEYKGKKLAVTICEDIWNLGDNPLYRICPMDRLILQKPDVMINLSASPFDYDHDESRREIIRENVKKYGLPMYYCNTVGSQTEIVFDGGSMVFNADGEIVAQLPFFEEGMEGVELDTLGKKKPDLETDILPNTVMTELVFDHNIERIRQAIVLSIRDYFKKMGFKQAILGSSGGIDSAVTLALAVEALGKENVRAILLPSPYSTDHSVDDAVALSKNLDNPYDIIRINDIYEKFLQTLEPHFKGLPFNVAEENMQSRIRGNLLMGLANKFGYILLNTSNKSELSTGYGTLYGDMAGGLSVLGDLYKMQVYALARHINREKEIIPANIIDKAPSAELRPNQKDSDSLPDYAILDRILYQYIERRQGPKEIVAQGFDAALVARTLKLVNTNEYKRNQFCPIIRVSSKAFGIGRRVPIVGKYLS
ncbi:NAD+ synthase [Chitinophaga deserti]|uniref:NAD+ synthase n=1 Tax=Chitinophaga deserti TaxID=2164099 RepID=UPI000D6AF747|nr:NAD+ synthase [Chitinophaga deserti]